MPIPLKTIASKPIGKTSQHRLLLLGLSCTRLEQFASGVGQPRYRGRQLYDWIYRRRESDFELMTDLPAAFRSILPEIAITEPLSILADREALDGARKLLFSTADGARIESVFIPEGDRLTVCLSSQVGCAVGCGFCATGKMGFQRNLSAGEIIAQLFAVERTIGQRMTNIVMMGMGEPLLNRTAVFTAARLTTNPDGIGLSRSKFTLSTVGWLPGIRAMTRQLRSPVETLPKIKLAISLNASTDEMRRQLMPQTERYPLNDIIAAAGDYARQSGETVSINYLLLSGVNDSDDDAKRLVKLFRNKPFKFHIMEYNEVGGVFRRSVTARLESFTMVLRKGGLMVTVRTSRGRDIAAACGQLAGEKNSSVIPAKAGIQIDV